MYLTVKKVFLFLSIVFNNLTLVVPITHATIEETQSSNKSTESNGTCKIFMHVYEIDQRKNIEFAFVFNKNFLNDEEASNLTKSLIFHLETVPTYEDFKNDAVNSMCWSSIELKANNKFLYISFLPGSNNDNYQIIEHYIHDCDQKIELNERLVTYQIAVESIQKNNGKIQFLYKHKRDSQPHPLLETKYQTSYLSHGMSLDDYSAELRSQRATSMSFMHWNSTEVLNGLAMAVIMSIGLIQSFFRNTIVNFPVYTLFFGCYMASFVSGAESNITGGHAFFSALKNGASTTEESYHASLRGVGMMDFMFEKKKLIAVGVVSLAAAGVIGSCALCLYGMNRLQKFCTPKKSQRDEMKLLSSQHENLETAIVMPLDKTKKKKKKKRKIKN